jgi:hypothetical protein
MEAKKMEERGKNQFENDLKKLEEEIFSLDENVEPVESDEEEELNHEELKQYGWEVEECE